MFAFYRALEILFNLIEILIIVRIFMSFLNLNTNSFIGKFVFELTEPVLAPAREILSRLGLNRGMFDFSPILAMLFLRILYSLILGLLR